MYMYSYNAIIIYSLYWCMMRTFEVDWVDYVVVNELKVRVSYPVLYVLFSAGEVVIYHRHLMPVQHEGINEM